MKFLVLSDIHGSQKYAQYGVDLFHSLKADKLILLGDLLYHGARNPLTEEYNPQGVAQLLNNIKEHIVAVRGNCDSEVDQMVLNFEMMQDKALIVSEDRSIFISHGHVYHPDKLPYMNKGDVFIYGHVHLPIAYKENGVYILNPGSITLPKENNPNSYGILEDDGFTIFDLDGKVIKNIQFTKE